MRLATLDDGTRDGRLVVISRDGKRMFEAPDYRTFQAALDKWERAEPELRMVAETLENDANAPRIEAHTRFLAPLPRAYQWLDGSAYLHHVRLVRQARGAEMPPSFLHDPLVYQGGSDTFLGHREPIAHASEDWGIDFEAELAVITDDVPYGTSAEDALKHIKFVLLLNDVSLRKLIPSELAKGFGFVVSKPPTAFAPFAVTPDELGEAWQGGRLHLPVQVDWNGEAFGAPNAGVGMQFHFGEIIAHIAKTRPLGAGTIIGSGTVSNDEPGVGSCCIAERRMIETIEKGAPETRFMRFGDTVRIEVLQEGRSVFGVIEQEVVQRGAAP